MNWREKMDNQNRNLILASVLSFLVIVVWYALFPPPEPKSAAPQEIAAQTVPSPTAEPSQSTAATASAVDQETASKLSTAPRVTIETDRLSGSLSLLGGRIDELSLKDYRETLDKDSSIVTLLAPFGSDKSYYAVFGWAAGTGVNADQVPDANTIWAVESGTTLGVDSPVTLKWDNGAGLIFRRTISIDKDYMFHVEQSVENTTAAAIRVAPYGIIARHGLPKDLKNFFVLHEGVVGMADGTLSEIDYDDIVDYPINADEGAQAEVTKVTSSGWVGFTDHFWMTTLIPAKGTAFKSVVKYDKQRDIYQTEAVLATQDVAAGQTVTVSMDLFAGAKEWETIRNYEAGRDITTVGASAAYTLGLASADADGIDKFLDSIDWGWFFFITKPMFWVLHELNVAIGNMGWAIIGLTLIIKAIMFPLAYKSYVSMAKMKKLQPQMEEIKKAAGDDRGKLQQSMMELYKKEKVNPAAGCLPILLQIPIFFSLYKVIFVTLELRHAPWIGWIRDLSAPDPSSILNLFGLLPWGTPDPSSIFFILSLGVLPILLGISMWLQQKLNPAPTDPTQAAVFAWMPWIFMFMLGSFASGLVVYWIANNTITFIQQYLIMRSQGAKPDIFGNIKSGLKRKKA